MAEEQKEAAKKKTSRSRTVLAENVFNFAPEEAAKDKIVEFIRPSSLDSIWKTSINDGCHNPSWPEFVPSGCVWYAEGTERRCNF
ncbi:hypothetical protein ACFXTH_004622 [Malus domestica]